MVVARAREINSRLVRGFTFSYADCMTCTGVQRNIIVIPGPFPSLIRERNPALRRQDAGAERRRRPEGRAAGCGE